MIIKSITIENFQSYYGEQTILFSKGLNLVIGKGGKGKSKLFNAFYWVLFGKLYITDVGWCDTDGLPQSSKGAMKRHEFINMKALCDAAVDSIVTAGVRLILEDDRGEEYIIERSVAAVRKKGNDWKDSYSWDVKPNILKVSYDSPTGTQVKVTYQAEDIIRRWMPGPLTVILQMKDHVPSYVNGGMDTLAIRMATSDALTALIRETGCPLFMPSANRSGEKTCTNLDEIELACPDLDGMMEGSTAFGQASTIADCTQEEVRILRPGPLTLEQLKGEDKNGR